MILQQLHFLEPPRVYEELFLVFLAHCSTQKAFTIPKNSCTVPPCDIYPVNGGEIKPLVVKAHSALAAFTDSKFDPALRGHGIPTRKASTPQLTDLAWLAGPPGPLGHRQGLCCRSRKLGSHYRRLSAGLGDSLECHQVHFKLTPQFQ